MSRKPQEYQSPGIVVRFEPKRCIHAAECVRGLPEVFDSKRRPWVQPDAAGAEAVAEVIRRCPTGALHFERRDGGEGESPPGRNRLRVSADGPLYGRGELEVQSNSGETLVADTRLALCRCGQSANKPFCDGAHTAAGFADAGEVAGQGLGEEADGDGRLVLRPLADGPLLAQGPLEIEQADGTVAFRGDKAALCRCGQSANKPFCDGSHKAAGFSAD